MNSVEKPDALAALAACLVDECRDALFAVSLDGTILSWNRGAQVMFGYEPQEAIGRRMADLLAPAESRRAMSDLLAGATAGAALVVEAARVRKDGKIIDVRSSVRRLDGVMAIHETDVTAEKKLESQVRELTRQKKDFLSTVSHELRTPLNSVIGFSELLHNGKLGELAPQHQEYMGDILTSARRLLQLVNDAVDVARTEAQDAVFRPERMNLPRVVTEVRDVLRPLEMEKRLRVTVQVDPAVAAPIGDAGRVRQILYYQLSNAIQSAPEEGRIVVQVAPEGPALFRMEIKEAPSAPVSAGARRQKDPGFGLALSKRMAEACGGRVEVRNVAGEGRTLSTILPREMQHES